MKGYPSSVLGIVSEFGITPDKKRGQCFLIENNILDRIPEATGVTKDDLVIEIGSGPGNLTARLSDAAARVMAFDTDRNFVPLYAKYFAGTNVDFNLMDFLAADMDQMIGAAKAAEPAIKKVKVVSNIPYYITSPIIEKLLYSKTDYDDIFLLMQTDVAERITAKPGTKDYSILSVACEYAAEVEFIKNISKNCFFPKPEVESTILRFIPLTRRRFAEFDEFVFFSIVKAAFNQRRKVARSAIANNVERIAEVNGYPGGYVEFLKAADIKALVAGAFESAGLDSMARAEDIGCEQYAALASYIGKLFKGKA